MTQRAATFCLWLLCLCTTGCAPAPEFHEQFLVFGTWVELTLADIADTEAKQASRMVQQQLQQQHNAWHAWQPSLVTEVNQHIAQQLPINIPPSLRALITQSRTLSRQSGYTFNPAIGQLIRLWGFQRDDDKIWKPPTAAAIQRLVNSAPSLEHVHIDNGVLRSDNADVQLDFGGIGKGYAIELALKTLKARGIQHALLNAGGDLKAIGQLHGQPWLIGIRHPNKQDLLGVLSISGEDSVFTSGSYERNYVYQGKQYHHIIDPRSGYPTRALVAVTVIHPSATVADAAATALMIQGTQGWVPLAKRLGLQYVLLLDEQGHITMSQAMASRVQLADKFKNNATIETLQAKVN